MHRTDNPTRPPLAVLDGLRRPRPKPYRLTEAEIVALRRRAKERSAYFRKASAHLKPPAADEVPKGDHMPPASVLAALHGRGVRRASPATTKYTFSPGGLHLAAQRARKERTHIHGEPHMDKLMEEFSDDAVAEIAAEFGVTPEEVRANPRAYISDMRDAYISFELPRAGGIKARETRVLVRRGRLVLALEPEELGPDDEVVPRDDPFFRKPGRIRVRVEAWGDAVIPPGAEDLG